MKLNKKGFTLIESIVTFAILAIAGGMFILGFYNVSVIASEGSIIKTETNDLYNSVISREPDDLDASYSLTFTFDDIYNSTSKVKCWTIEGESKLDQFTIRLLRCIPADTLNDWAEPETTDDEMVDATIRFHLRWLMSNPKTDFPYYKRNNKGQEIALDLSHKGQSAGVAYEFFSFSDNSNPIKIKKKATTSLYNEQYILSCLNKVPTVQEIDQSKIFPQEKGDEIIWYQIQKQSDGCYDIIGFRKSSRITEPNLVIVLDGSGNVMFSSEGVSIPWNDALNFMSGKQAKSIRDGKLYNAQQIEDNRTKYNINIYTME